MADVSQTKVAPTLTYPTKLKRPVYNTDVSEYDEAYLDRKEEVEEGEYTLKNGRKLCYFKGSSSLSFYCWYTL